MAIIAAFAAGFALRAFQICVVSSLYLLIGFLTAGAARAMIGPAGLRQFFGTGRWSGPIRAWAVAATLLPVCSLGVLPILAELRRSGVRRDSVLTFALAGPMLNPISLMYGISYLGPQLMAIFATGTFLVAIAVGLACGRPGVEPGGGVEDEGPIAAGGSRRLVASAVFAARGASGPILGDILLGGAVACLVAASLTPGDLAEGAFAGDPRSIPRIASASILSYVAPEKGMVALPEMIKFGQSPGAMFCLLVLGVGMSAGHLSWIARSYRPVLALRWGVSAVVLALAGAYAVEAMVPNVGTANADNDHFEELANPFDPDHLASIPARFGRYAEHVPLPHWLTLGAVLALIGSGVAIRGRRFRFEETRGPVPPGSPSALDAALPRRAVAGVAALAGLATGVAGLYAYFPAPDEAFRDMAIIKADLYGEIDAHSRAVPLHHLDLWDRQVSRLPIGARIRLSPRTVEAGPSTAELVAGIARLRVAIENGRGDEARSIFHGLREIYTKCRQAYGAG